MAKTKAVTLEGEKNAILSLLASGEDQHWQIGAHYNRIVAQQLAQRAGYSTAAEFVAQELHAIPQSTLSLYGAVAAAFSEAEAVRHGVTKLALLLTYERLTRAKPPKDPAQAKIRVASGKTLTTKTFNEVSSRELQAAIRAHTGGVSSGKPIPARDKKRIDALRKALFRALGDHAHAALRAETRGRQTVLTLDGVPLDLFHAAVAAMSKA